MYYSIDTCGFGGSLLLPRTPWGRNVSGTQPNVWPMSGGNHATVWGLYAVRKNFFRGSLCHFMLATRCSEIEFSISFCF